MDFFSFAWRTFGLLFGNLQLSVQFGTLETLFGGRAVSSFGNLAFLFTDETITPFPTSSLTIKGPSHLFAILSPFNFCQIFLDSSLELAVP